MIDVTSYNGGELFLKDMDKKLGAYTEQHTRNPRAVCLI